MSTDSNMAYNIAKDLLRSDEGCALEAYPDPLSGGEPYTVGYGHTGPEVHPGMQITLDQAERYLDTDLTSASLGLRKALPWFEELDPVRQAVLLDMAFNLGVDGLLEFHHTLKAVRAGDWKAAAAGMTDSLWARQVKGRAYRLAEIMRTGAYQL